MDSTAYLPGSCRISVKHLMLIACLLLIGTPLLAQPVSTGPATSDAGDADHQALRALVPIYEQAASEGKPQLLNPYLDPEFTGVMVTGDEVDGPASLGGYWSRIQGMIGQGGTYHVKVNVAAPSIISGDIAVSRGTTNETVVTANGKTYEYQGRWTAVSRKRDGQWKLLRIHGSMDPIGNPFVAATVQRSVIVTAAIAGAAGLILAFVLTMLFRGRKAVPSHK